MTVSTQGFSRRRVIGSQSVCFRNALYIRWALILCFNQASENKESNLQLQIWSSLSLLSLVIGIKNIRWVWPQGVHPKSVGLFLFSKYKGCVEECFKVQEFPPPQTLTFDSLAHPWCLFHLCSAKFSVTQCCEKFRHFSCFSSPRSSITHFSFPTFRRLPVFFFLVSAPNSSFPLRLSHASP